ncbi:hypothetical protein AEAC466_19395 [Asticcacaulis sp. AC466]|uniref:HNH endonuclease n=1 Tax=Asticcacaulis sp. AC466 TaxID=1282362 RepID=UPI0003C3C4C7|nr:hypothetical protein [Asticcacaulis sp. AC466]ESQ82084.1 hypothetical protein AEAC466_19395 [Asticcacaulis sp. AC466]
MSNNILPLQKVYSSDTSTYTQKTVRLRLEALFLNNVGLVLTRDQILAAATDPVTQKEPENWHQRLSELRTDSGYTILSWRDWNALKPQEYVLASVEKRDIAGKRVRPTTKTWAKVMARANSACEWKEDGQSCGLAQGAVDPIGGGTVKLTPDHVTPHSVDPNSDPENPDQWQALCGRHQVMKKNFWDGATGKVNVIAILQAAGTAQKKEALDFLKQFFGENG